MADNVLWIITDDVDSYDHTRPMRVTHAFPVPVTAYGREEWEEWVLDRCLDVDRHEWGSLKRPAALLNARLRAA